MLVGPYRVTGAARAFAEHTRCFVQNLAVQDCAILGLTTFLCWKAMFEASSAARHVRAETVALCIVAASTAISVRGELLPPGPARAVIYRVGMLGAMIGSYFTLAALLPALQ